MLAGLQQLCIIEAELVKRGGKVCHEHRNKLRYLRTQCKHETVCPSIKGVGGYNLLLFGVIGVNQLNHRIAVLRGVLNRWGGGPTDRLQVIRVRHGDHRKLFKVSRQDGLFDRTHALWYDGVNSRMHHG